ncbi:MAG: PSD1 and planctomycete cytochrome C domain-containing protein [bacterium]|nr:PSD1 and planctomycete cytochrome C domain-containing protein [bacterium]
MKAGSSSCWCLLVCLATSLANAQTQERVSFSDSIRPLLSDRCFQCHGPDETAREAGLRLDTQSGLVEDLGGYAAVVPGDAAASELFVRITSQDPDVMMPPPESNKSLSREEVTLIEKWIEQGAEWQQHWSFKPLAEPQPEASGNEPPGDASWPLNGVDVFVLNQLQKQDLQPSAEADPYTLVRRLYLDLIGLPPTVEEADAWVRRLRPNYEAGTNESEIPEQSREIDERAYQQLVDSLLASPRYGERWARLWLDLARYADTNGYEKDRERSIWPYRDWVIQTLNNDQPFDQFTIEQIAGDMLEGATVQQRVATGFHRNTMLNEEGGIDPLEFRFHAMADRVATTGTTWLGLTLACCQCHTHKYDPISHQEYYQLMALLNNADEPQLELHSEDVQEQWERNQQEARKLLDELASHWPENTTDLTDTDPKATQHAKAIAQEGETPTETRHEANSPAELTNQGDSPVAATTTTLEVAFAQWLKNERENACAWQILRPTAATSNLPILTIQEDQSIFASGDTAKRDDYYVDLAPSTFPLTAIQLEALPDARLPARGPGSTYYEGTLGDFFLTEFEVQVDKSKVKIESASETYAKNRFGSNPVSASLAIDGDIQTGWSVHDRQGERHVAVFAFSEPIPPGMPIRVHISFGRHFASSLGRFRFRGTQVNHVPLARDYSDRTTQLLLKPENQLEPSEREELMNSFLMQAPELKEHADRIRELQRRPEGITTLVMQEWPAEFQRKTFRHHRGEYLQPQEEVLPGTPQVLPAMRPDLPRNRLGLAHWLVAEDNPLTARVVVNRAWAAFFGQGLVRTVDDFGLQGASPTHPELLDWLALRWMHDDQWSMKKLHRRIVSSRTYRQSSQVSPDAGKRDPDNRWLSYFPRVRLDGELIRDSLLNASDSLVADMGGPPVRPPQPEGITEVTFGSPKWPVSEGGDRYRRSVYTMSKRTAPFAMYATFDAPSGEACIAARVKSNSPLQALTLLNDEMLLEYARAAGRRYQQRRPDTLEVSLRDLFRSVLTRPPTAVESELLQEFWQQQFVIYEEQPALARQLLGDPAERTAAESSKTSTQRTQASEAESEVGDREPAAASESQALAQQAAWTATARAIFSLDEAQTRE